jgi:hypothetical protein
MRWFALLFHIFTTYCSLAFVETQLGKAVDEVYPESEWEHSENSITKVKVNVVVFFQVDSPALTHVLSLRRQHPPAKCSLYSTTDQVVQGTSAEPM